MSLGVIIYSDKTFPLDADISILLEEMCKFTISIKSAGRPEQQHLERYLPFMNKPEANITPEKYAYIELNDRSANARVLDYLVTDMNTLIAFQGGSYSDHYYYSIRENE